MSKETHQMISARDALKEEAVEENFAENHEAYKSLRNIISKKPEKDTTATVLSRRFASFQPLEQCQ